MRAAIHQASAQRLHVCAFLKRPLPSHDAGRRRISNEPFYGSPMPRSSRFDSTRTNDGMDADIPFSFPADFPPLPERLQLLLTNASTALQDPTRADAVAAVGELTGQHALETLVNCMSQDETGKRILQDRPLVSKATIPYQKLLVEGAAVSSTANNEYGSDTTSSFLPPDDSHLTFGQAYGAYLKIHGFDPDARDSVRYLEEDSDEAYVMLRYRQCHDFWHALTGLPPTVVGELGLKWLELFQTGLPLAAFSVTAGTCRLTNAQEQHVLWKRYWPWAVENAQRMPFGTIMNVEYEKEWDTKLGEFRQRLGLTRAPC